MNDEEYITVLKSRMNVEWHGDKRLGYHVFLRHPTDPSVDPLLLGAVASTDGRPITDDEVEEHLDFLARRFNKDAVAQHMRNLARFN